MNEEALNAAYQHFTGGGYNGSVEDFKNLMSTNSEAFSASFNNFKNGGYKGSIEDFSKLIGVELGKMKGAVEVDVTAAPQPVSAGTGLASESDFLESKGQTGEDIPWWQTRLANLAAGPLEFAEGVGSYWEALQLSALELIAPDKLTGEEKLGAFSSVKAVSSSMSGATGIPSSTNMQEMVDKLDKYTPKYENQSITEDIFAGNYSQAAERTLDSGLRSLPSLAAAFLGPGGLAALMISSAGRKFEEELIEDPETNTGNLLLNATGTGATEAVFEVVTRGILKKAGFIFKKDGINAAKEFLEAGAGHVVKKFGGAVLGEAASEAGTELTIAMIDAMPRGLRSLGFGLGKSVSMESLTTRLGDAAIVGGFVGGKIQTVGTARNALLPESKQQKQQREKYETVLMHDGIKGQIINSAEKINKLAEDLPNATPEGKEVINKKIEQEKDAIVALKKKNSILLSNLKGSDLKAYAENIKGINEAKKLYKNAKTESEKNIAEANFNELLKANALLIKTAAGKELSKNISKIRKISKDIYGDGLEIKEFTREEAKAFMENDPNLKTDEKESYALEAYESQGFFHVMGKDGKEYLVINKDVAGDTYATNVAGHEFLHKALDATLKNDPEIQKQVGKALRSAIDEMDANQVETSEFVERLKRYKDKPEGQQAEEILTVLSDSLKEGDLDFQEGFLVKVGDVIRRALQDIGLKGIRFDTGRDVYNFIKDYNVSVKKERLKGSMKKAAIEGVKEGKLLEKVEPKEVDTTKPPEVESKTKMSKASSDKVQSIYNEQGEAGAFDIINEFKPIVNRIAESRRGAPNFDKQLLVDEIETGKRGIYDLIRDYPAYVKKQEKAGKEIAPLAGFINKWLPARAIEASREVLGEEFTDDITEKVDIAAEEAPTPEVKAKPRKKKIVLAERLGVSEDVSKAISKLVPTLDLEGLTFKSLKNKIPNITGKLFGISPKKIISGANITKKELQSAQMFISKNVDLLIAMLPEGATAGGTATGIPNTLLKAFYAKTGRAKMAGTGSKAGLAIQVKNPNITRADFLETFGIIDGKPDRTDRNTSARVLALANLTGKMITNQAVRQQLNTDNAKAKEALRKLEDGKSKIMFSKNEDGKLDPLDFKNAYVDYALGKWGAKFGIKRIPTKEAVRIKSDGTKEKYRTRDLDAMLNDKETYGDGASRVINSFLNEYPQFRNLFKITLTGGLKGGIYQFISNFNDNINSSIGIETYAVALEGMSDKELLKLADAMKDPEYFRPVQRVATEFEFESASRNDLIKAIKKQLTTDYGKPRSLREMTEAQVIKIAELMKDPEYFRPVQTKLTEFKTGSASLNDLIKAIETQRNKKYSKDINRILNIVIGKDAAQINISAFKFNIRKRLDAKAIEKTKTKKFKEDNDSRLPFLYDFFKAIESHLKENPQDVWLFEEMLIDTGKHQNTFTRILAPFSFYAINPKTRKPLVSEEVVEEHTDPQNQVGKAMLTAAMNGKVDEMWQVVGQSYMQGSLLKVDDNLLADNSLAATMPDVYFDKVVPRLISGELKLPPGFSSIVRLAVAGIDLNNYMLVGTDMTIAEFFKVDNIKDIETANDLVIKQLTGEVTADYAENASKVLLKSNLKETQALNKAIKVSRSSFSRSIGDENIIKVGKWNLDISTKQGKKIAAELANIKTVSSSEFKRVGRWSLDTSTKEGKRILAQLEEIPTVSSSETKGITVLDFDDTLATTKSNVLYTMPDGTEGTLNAEEFAKQGGDLLAQGAKFDFSEFNKVVEGKTAPLFNKAMKLAGKFGTDNMFVLTARSPESAKAIKQFLDAQGLDIPLKNITGLGKSEAEAKALWIAEKVGEGYNDFYFADDAIQNVKAVKNMLDQFDVKSKVQQARVKFSRDMDANFNQILEDVIGIEAVKRFSDMKARKRGESKGKFRFFIPPSHEDFVGLLYNFMGKGRKGDAHRDFWEQALVRPLNRANRELDTARQSIANDFRSLNKRFPGIKKKLKKKIPKGDFTYEDAIRVYLWDFNGHDIPGISKTDQKELVDFVNSNPELQAYAGTLMTISKQEAYVNPTEGWESGDIRMDLNDATGRVGREEYFAEFLQNADIIFSEENLNKIEAGYGKGVREALEDMLYRIKTGRNRPSGSNALVNRFVNYINGAVGSVMFFNIRSAVLQQMSIVNYINFADNNIFSAAKAFANQKQYWSDWAHIFNSDMLKQRRGGIQTDVNGSELAETISKSKFPMRTLIRELLKLGFTPTQIGDNIAIATGGATYYRNRIKTYLKQGLSQAEAEAKAWTDFQDITQSTQQSARPDMVSQQQASPLGKFILAFQNVTSQFNRLGKKAFLDIKNRRITKPNTSQFQSDISNVSRLVYYFGVQNVLFYSLQTALFAAMFDDDEDDEKFLKKKERIINGSIDSVLRGAGVMGAIISTMKNMVIKFAEQREAGYNKDESAVLMEMLNVSPPLGIKARKVVGAEKTLNYNKKAIEEMETFDIDNPQWSAATSYIEGVTNIPVNRLYNKTQNVKEALDNQHSAWQRALMFMGWSKYNLGAYEEKEDSTSSKKKKKKRRRRSLPKYEN
jgi:hypothetical protein